MDTAAELKNKLAQLQRIYDDGAWPPLQLIDAVLQGAYKNGMAMGDELLVSIVERWKTSARDYSDHESLIEVLLREWITVRVPGFPREPSIRDEDYDWVQVSFRADVPKVRKLSNRPFIQWLREGLGHIIAIGTRPSQGGQGGQVRAGEQVENGGETAGMSLVKEGGGKANPGAAQGSAGYLSSQKLAEANKLPSEAVRKRLRRWQNNHDGGWIESPNPGPNEPKFLYEASAVRPVIDAMKEKAARQAKASGQRPATK